MIMKKNAGKHKKRTQESAGKRWKGGADADGKHKDV